MKEVLEYYLKHGIMTEIRSMKHMVKGLPKDIESIVAAVQNIFLHQHWAKSYGIELNEKRKQEPWVRSIEDKLILLGKHGYQHILDKKPLEHRMIGICRDFSVMAAALCRETGIPARARCGFATYFEKGKYVDHWVLEYWNEDKKRWVLADAQLDDFQKEKLNIAFDTIDIDDEFFITGPRAWKLCREGKLDAELFGIFQWWGFDYLKCNLILDCNSLIKVPMQPWDGWEGYKNIPVSEWSENDYLIMDQLAELALQVDNDLNALNEFIEQHEKIKVPKNLERVINYLE